MYKCKSFTYTKQEVNDHKRACFSTVRHHEKSCSETKGVHYSQVSLTTLKTQLLKHTLQVLNSGT